MIVTLSQRTLAGAVRLAKSAINGKSSLEIVKHIRLLIVDGKLRVTGTDLVMWAESDIDVVSVELDGSESDECGYCFPADRLDALISRIPTGIDVRIDTTPTGNKATISYGRENPTMAYLPGEEYPGAPDVPALASCSMTTESLSALIGFVSAACGTDETRPLLTGALFEISEDAMKAVGTDTHRLAVRTMPTISATGKAVAIIPNDTMRAVRANMPSGGAVEIVFGTSGAKFTSGAVTVVSRLLEGKYPNYERVIPSGHDRTVMFNRKDLLDIVKRADIYAADNANRLVFTTGDGAFECEVTANSSTLGAFRAFAEVATTGPGVTMAFNAKYLADALNAYDGTEGVTFEITEPLRPAIVRESRGVDDGVAVGEGLIVLMPMVVI